MLNIYLSKKNKSKQKIIDIYRILKYIRVFAIMRIYKKTDLYNKYYFDYNVELVFPSFAKQKCITHKNISKLQIHFDNKNSNPTNIN